MSETGALAQINQARRFLEQAKDLTDIKAVRDMAEAARLYARAAGLGQAAVNEATEIKLRAERKAGEALKARPMNVGHKFAGDAPGASPAQPPTLAEDGITPKQSMQWQDEAALPDADFEALVAASIAEGTPLTSKAVARKGRAARDAATHAAMAQSRETAAPSTSRINSQRVLDARLRAAVSKALASASEICALDPGRVLEVLSVADAERTEARLVALGLWFEGFRAARESSGPRMIGRVHG